MELRQDGRDIRRRTKEKIAHNKTSANKTGGGAAVEETSLTNIAQQEQFTFWSAHQAAGQHCIWSHDGHQCPG